MYDSMSVQAIDSRIDKDNANKHMGVWNTEYKYTGNLGATLKRIDADSYPGSQSYPCWKLCLISSVLKG